MGMFIELLQLSLGARDQLSRAPNEQEWSMLLDEANKQALVGVLFCGLERLPKDELPPRRILLKWVGLEQIIVSQNEITSKVCATVCERFARDGFRVCVLKGQANHRYYPENMAKRRTCGDVDVWVRPIHDSHILDHHFEWSTLEYITKKYKLTGLCWLHCNFDEGEVPIEVHFHASFMNNPSKNRQLQTIFELDKCVCKELIDGIELPVMRVEKDVVYQMNHIYRHLLDEGVGLRQIVDYYFVLKKYHIDNGTVSPELLQMVSMLGMKQFAGALMWVLGKICAMPQEWMICEPVEKDGKFLLQEIRMAGNFGQADPRMSSLNTSSLYNRRFSQAWRRIKRNMRFLTRYPSEVIWEPITRLYHFVWRSLILFKL